MSHQAPHFLLYSDVGNLDREYRDLRAWRFVLHSEDGSERLEAADVEPKMSRSRLELLSVIRGLEALDQPSRVTLVTSSRYVGSGLHHGLEQWRQTNYQWDEFGVLTPIKNEDLWRRLDHALQYHELDCRVRKGKDVPPDLAVQFRVERSHLSLPTPPRLPAESLPEQHRDNVAREQPAAAHTAHWPRRPQRLHRVIAALGTVAAAAAIVLAVGR